MDKIKLIINTKDGKELNRDVDGFEFIEYILENHSNCLVLKTKGYMAEKIYDITSFKTANPYMSIDKV